MVGFNIQLKKKLLLFTTGSDRIPVGGMSEMKFKITRMEGSNGDKMYVFNSYNSHRIVFHGSQFSQ